MTMPAFGYAWLASLLCFGAGSLHAAVIYDEAVSGDLSDDGPTPSVLGALEPGVNMVSGTMGGSPLDRDIFTFSIAPGQQLTQIDLSSYAVLSGSAGGGSFFTAGAGDTSGAPSSASSFGFVITSSTGGLFSADLPAGPGNYNMWIQETAGGAIGYTMEFTVVPEPAASGLAALGVVFFLRRKRSRE